MWYDGGVPRRNLTLQLDGDVIRNARVIAAKRSTSLSRMVAEQIEQIVQADSAYRASEREALKILHRGFHLGGKPLKRDELHER